MIFTLEYETIDSHTTFAIALDFWKKLQSCLESKRTINSIFQAVNLIRGKVRVRDEKDSNNVQNKIFFYNLLIIIK